MNSGINFSKNKLTAYLLSFFLVFQNFLAAYSAASEISDQAIRRYLSTNPQFEKLSDSTNLYYSARSYLEYSGSRQEGNLQGFLRGASENGMGIFLDEFTELGYSAASDSSGDSDFYLLGTDFVQEKFIQLQFKQLLGRNLTGVGGDISESELLEDLYDAALELSAENPILKFGIPLLLQFDVSNLSADLVWPEILKISGQNVLIPRLYLSQDTLINLKLAEAIRQFNGETIFADLQLDNAELRLGREAFLQTTGDLVNNGGLVTDSGHEETIEILVGNTLKNLSGVFEAKGGLNIGANSIESSTIVHNYSFDGINRDFYGEIASFNSENGDVVLRTNGNIALLGTNISAGSGITLSADGSIYVGGVPLQSSEWGDEDGWQYRRSSVDYLTSSLTAEDTIQLIAQKEIVLDAAEIVSSQGHIELLAELGITVRSLAEQSQYTAHGKFGKTKKNVSAYKTVAIRSLLDAGLGVTIHSELGDINLTSVDVTSNEGTHVKASNGTVNLLVTTNNDHYSYSSVREGTFTTKTKQRGHEIEDVVNNMFVGGLKVDAAKGLNVEYRGDPDLSFEEQIAAIGEMPGMDWMTRFMEENRDNPKIDWTAIEGKYDSWDKSNTSLSPAFAAVVAIAVAIATSGAAAGFASFVTGSATTAASLGTLGTAIAAGASSFISQAALAVANGAVNGDVGGALEDLASDDTLEAMAVAMVTAGAVAHLNAEFFNVTEVNGESLLWTETSQAAQAAGDAAFRLTFEGQILQALTQSAVQTGVQTLVYGGDLEDFGEGLVYSMAQTGVNKLGEHMANKIKSAFDVQDASAYQTAMRYIAHAGAGCIIGAASSGLGDSDAEKGCAAGAGGAVVGELIADVHRSQTKVTEDVDKIEAFLEKHGLSDPDELTPAHLELLASDLGETLAFSEIQKLQKQGIDLARFGAALGAFVAGADASGINIAANAGENAAENNALFLIPIAIVILKAVDLAITANDYINLANDLEAAGDNESARRQVLVEFFGEEIKGAALEILVEQALKKLLPGITTAEKLLEIASENNIVPKKLADKILDKVGQQKRIANKDVPATGHKVSQARYDELAEEFTQNKDSDTLVLGRWVEDSPLSYEKIADDLDATFYQTGDYKALGQELGDDNRWFVNKSFMRQQWDEGKEILLTHDPYNPKDSLGGASYEKEILELIDLGAKEFDKIGENLWKVRR